MNGLAVVAGVSIFFLGYAFARHETETVRWLTEWLIGRAGRQETRLRRIETTLGLPVAPEDTDRPSPPTRRAALAARARAVVRWLGERTEPQLEEQPPAEQATQPIAAQPEPAQPDDIDTQLARFTFNGGRRP